MSKILLLPIFCFLLCKVNAQDAGSWSNPLDVQFGDPFVLRTAGGQYYMYGTGAGAENGFVAYSSGDLKNWKREGQVYYGNNKNGWGEHSYWAPEVYERNGKYYLFYSAQWKVNPGKDLENFKIGVAVADKPTGPFIDIQNKPVFDPGYPIIDANVLFAKDGKTYLYYSRCCYKHSVESEVATWARKKGWFNEVEESWVYGVEMKPDLSGVIGEPVLLLRPPVKMNDPQSEWESRSVTSKEVNRRWTEGSFIFKKGDTYYMMYSANYFGGKNYAVGYATSKNPLGPFKKAANNPVLQKNTATGGIVTGTGHNSVTYAPDGKTMLCVYHGRTSKTGDERVVFIDKMKITKDGLLTVEGPTTGIQQQAGTRNPLLADPTLFFSDGKYYLYGTVSHNSDNGFKAYSSVDKITWKDEGYVLRKGESYGTKGFWAPQIFKHQGKFYMAYTANEHIAIASADGPLGPFTQKEQKPLEAPVRMIDPYIYFDQSGKVYLYHVRLQNGNRIFVAELDKDLSAIDTTTVKECISASLPWEDTQNVQWKVAEGPTVIRHDGLYYMTYSANDFRNPDYAIGYATAANPSGPWTKSGSPIISRKNTGMNGTGHGDILVDTNGKILYVFHVHASETKVAPRRTALIELQFNRDKNNADELVTQPKTFRLLNE